MMPEDLIDFLFSKDQITSVLVQYWRAADRRDLDSLKSVYWPDAIDDHQLFKGNAHLFCEMNVATAAEICVLTQHTITNVDCRIDGDRAYVESYIQAYHRVVGEQKALKILMGDAYAEAHANSGHATHDCLTGGQYFDHFERRGGVWKIIDRVARRDWSIGQPSSLTSDDALKNTLTSFGGGLNS